MRNVITNAVIYTGREIQTGISILLNEGRVEGFVYDEDIPDEYIIHDLGGHCISPAFIDLQIYGGNGQLFSASPTIEAINATHEYCLQGGAADFLLTISTNSREVFSKGITVAKEYLKKGGKGMLGLHLEGPWINPEKRGAHVKEYIVSPTMENAKQLVEEAEGIVKMITLAPEMVDESIVDYLQQNGIIISAGHSNASYQQATKGFEKIKLVTHLFNAMSAFQSREPGMVGAIYNHDSVRCSIVADGIHVDFASVEISKKILGERLFLITDAVTTTEEGPYKHGFKNDRYLLPDGTLSGSALTMMKAVKNCVDHCGMDKQEALRMATVYPARILGIEKERGFVERNTRAAFAVFDNEMNLIKTIDFS